MPQSTKTNGDVPQVTADPSMPLQDAVLFFMKQAGQLTEMGFPHFDAELRQNRWKMLMGHGELGKGGELTEYMEAEAHDDLPEVVDGLIDMMWVIMGTLYTYVGPKTAFELMQEVARANISKVDGSIAPLEVDDYGKVIKPQGWVGPDIEGVLKANGWKLNSTGTPIRD